MERTRIKRRKRKQRKKTFYHHFFFFFVAHLRVLFKKNRVTSVSGAQILNHPWIWYSHNIQSMIKILNQNITQHGTQTTVLTYISINNTIELNELIYAGANLVCEKIGSPLKAWRKNQKLDGKFDWKRSLKKLRKQAKMTKQKKNAGQKGKGNTRKKIIQLEEINQKFLAKEGRLKRYRESVK